MKRIARNDAKNSVGELLRLPQISASTISEKVRKGDYSLKLSQQQYDKHLDGTRDYIRYMEQRLRKGYNPQSRLNITKDEAQKFLKRKAEPV